MGINYLNLSWVVFETISTIKDEKSAAKFYYIKTVSAKVVAQSIAFRVVLALGWSLPSEILAVTDPPPPEGSEFWQILPCSASTVRDRKRSSLWMPLAMVVGLGPGHTVLDGNPAPRQKGHNPQFLAHVWWPNGWMDQNSAWMGGRLRLQATMY